MDDYLRQEIEMIKKKIVEMDQKIELLRQELLKALNHLNGSEG